MEKPCQSAIGGNKGTVEINGDVVCRDWLKHSRRIRPVQAQCAGGFSPEIHARHERERSAVAFRIQYVLRVHVAMLALSN